FMEGKHLIALDLDGTLLTDDKQISMRNRETLKKAIDEGHIVVIATGRPHRASIDYYHTLALDTPMVNFNGALINHPAVDKWDELHKPMSVRTAHRIVDSCYCLKVHNILAEVMDNVYMDRYNEKIMEIFQTTRQDDSPITIGSLKNKLQTDPTSLLIHPKEEDRKSTRLNSSHVSISYAVFCLKKKRHNTL